MNHGPSARELFLEARSLPDAEREAFLARACGADPTLALRVTQLLQHHGHLGDLFDLPDDLVAEAAAVEPLPERVGPYRIRALRGRGGMGVVYVAESPEPGAPPVALKMLRPDRISPASRQRLAREAAMLRRLDHPGIVRLLDDSLEVGGTAAPYLVMELVDGQPLSAFLRAHPLDLRAKLELLIGVADALAAAHEQGIVHRDLKPSNILVTVDAGGVLRPRLVDFGIARLARSDAPLRETLTETGVLVGTLRYMSPEQIEAVPERIDQQSDVYSLGVIGYEMIAGLLPYDLPDSSVTRAIIVILRQEPRRLGLLDPSYRGDLELVFEKALAKSPAERYATASAFRDDLRRFQEGRTVRARPTLLRRLRRGLSRRRGVTAVALALATSLALGVGAWKAKADLETRIQALCAEIDDVDRLRASPSLSPDEMRDGMARLEQLRTELMHIPRQPFTPHLERYLLFRNAELAYFLADVERSPELYDQARRCWLDSGRIELDPRGLDPLSPTMPLVQGLRGMESHVEASLVGAVDRKLAAYRNPVKQLSLAVVEHQKAFDDCLARLRQPPPEHPPAVRREDACSNASAELGGSLLELGIATDSLSLVQRAIDCILFADSMASGASDPDAHTARLYALGKAHLARAELSLVPADLDRARHYFMASLDPDSPTPELLSRVKLGLARVDRAAARTTAEPREKLAYLESGLDRVREGRRSVHREEESYEYASTLSNEAWLRTDRADLLRSHGTPDRVRRELTRAAACLDSAEMVFSPRRFPIQHAERERERGRLLRIEWQLTRDPSARDRAELQLSRSLELLPAAQSPRHGRLAHAELDQLRERVASR